MKSVFSVLTSSYNGNNNRNPKIIVKLLLILLLIVSVFSIIFQILMKFEGQEHSWAAAFYWCFVVMSTLGFGDITFHSDLGRIFSVIVLLSGTFFMLILLPFFFIQFFFIPWLEENATKRASRKVSPDIDKHVILTGLGSIEYLLIKKLNAFKVPYVILSHSLENALALQEQGYYVLHGEIDDPETYKNAQIQKASLIATTSKDTINTNVAFTVREVNENIPIIATASSSASVDILELAGCNRVLELGKVLGESFARRITGDSGKSHIIGEMGSLLIAEACISHPSLIGKKLKDLPIRETANVTIVGTWERGRFELAGAETTFTKNSMVILAGTKDQLETYNKSFTTSDKKEPFVLIIGRGRVGASLEKTLEAQGIAYRVIDKSTDRITNKHNHIYGDAAKIEILEKAGFNKATTVVITTHDDDVNVFLTIYCRRLKPEIQILSRSNEDRNTNTLHRAGADFVLSYASIGANALFNLLRRMDTILIAEGLSAFRIKVPENLAGKSLKNSKLRESTGCSIVAIVENDLLKVNPESDKVLPKSGELIIIGDAEAENKLMEKYPFENLSHLQPIGK